MAGASRLLTFLFILVLASVLNYTQGRRGSSHSSSYSHSSTGSHSSSGSSHHSHPTSSHTGSGHSSSSHSSSGTHSYPSSNNGLSGNHQHNGFSSISHKNPSLGTNHGYPKTNTGLSGTNHDRKLNHQYPTSSSGLSGINHNSEKIHEYPISNTGLSGTGQHSGINNGYPSSNSGLSGINHNSGKNHNYPNSNTGISGTGEHSGLSHRSTSSASRLSEKNHQGSLQTSSHAYPSSSGGLSGNKNPSFHNNVVHSDTDFVFDTKPHTVSYPNSGGLSGTGNNNVRIPTGVLHNYPTSGGSVNKNYNSISGHSTHQNVANPHNIRHHHDVDHSKSYKKEVYHHYHYNYIPPKFVYYTPYGGKTVSYPVFREQPPIYVYQYKSSGSKYSNLLAGLALYNLGQSSANPNLLHYHKNYRPEKEETCLFGVRYDNGNYDEMAIDCIMITNFIWVDQMSITNPIESQKIVKNISVVTNTTITTNFITNNQTIYPNGSILNPAISKNEISILPNGTLVPINSSTHIIPPTLLATLVDNTKDPSIFTPNNVSSPITYNHTIIDNLILVPHLEMTNISISKLEQPSFTNATIDITTLAPNGKTNIDNNNSFPVLKNMNTNHLSMLPNGSLVSNVSNYKENQILLSPIITTNNDTVAYNRTLISMLPVSSPLISQPSTDYTMLPNGTLVSSNSTTIVSTVTTEFISAMDSRYKGAPVEIKPHMECYVKRKTPWSTMGKTVSCGLLENYSSQSLINSAIKPSLNMFVVAIVVYGMLLSNQ